MKRTGNLLFYFSSFFIYPVRGFYFFTRLNLLCCSVNPSNGETMVTNNLLCFNEKYVSWWETKPRINTEGTLNNGPLAGVCPKLFFCSLPSIPVPVWLWKIVFHFLRKHTQSGARAIKICNKMTASLTAIQSKCITLLAVILCLTKSKDLHVFDCHIV